MPARDIHAALRPVRRAYDADAVQAKLDALAGLTEHPIRHLRSLPYDPEYLRGNIENPIGFAHIPVGIIGPLPIDGERAVGDFFVPMATAEGALALTYEMGCFLLRLSGPVKTEVVRKTVHVSPMFVLDAPSDEPRLRRLFDERFAELRGLAEQDSGHTHLLEIRLTRLDGLLVTTFLFDTEDAHGLNMINQAAFACCEYIEQETGVRFFHRSHFSGVKHFSPKNVRDGYGLRVRATATITRKALRRLNVTARDIKAFTDHCITCATAAGIEHVNVHASNAIAALFLATGQDCGDLVNAAVCCCRCTLANGGSDLFWEVDIPNLNLATVGGGTHLGSQRECLEILGCRGAGRVEKLAEIIAATVLAGEVPTAAAVVNRTYVDAHEEFGRNRRQTVI